MNTQAEILAPSPMLVAVQIQNKQAGVFLIILRVVRESQDVVLSTTFSCLRIHSWTLRGPFFFLFFLLLFLFFLHLLSWWEADKKRHFPFTTSTVEEVLCFFHKRESKEMEDLCSWTRKSLGYHQAALTAVGHCCCQPILLKCNRRWISHKY